MSPCPSVMYHHGNNPYFSSSCSSYHQPRHMHPGLLSALKNKVVNAVLLAAHLLCNCKHSIWFAALASGVVTRRWYVSCIFRPAHELDSDDCTRACGLSGCMCMESTSTHGKSGTFSQNMALARFGYISKISYDMALVPLLLGHVEKCCKERADASVARSHCKC